MNKIIAKGICHYCTIREYPADKQCITICHFEKGNGLAMCYLLENS